MKILISATVVIDEGKLTPKQYRNILKTVHRTMTMDALVDKLQIDVEVKNINATFIE